VFFLGFFCVFWGFFLVGGGFWGFWGVWLGFGFFWSFVFVLFGFFLGVFLVGVAV